MLAEPQFWHCLAEYLKLDRRLRHEWWAALYHARWQAARQWRQKLLLFEQRGPHTLESVMAFWQHTITSAEVLKVLEELCAERRLSRQQATAIEEHIFERLDATGAWR